MQDGPVALEATGSERKSVRRQSVPLQKLFCDFQISRSRIPRFSIACRAPTPSAAIAIPLMNSWTSTAQNGGCRSVLWFSKTVVVRYIGCIPSRVTLLRAPSISGIRRVKGVKKPGVRLGNWLTAEQGHALWQAPDTARLKGKSDRALPGILLACGLRRHEVAELSFDHLQQREGHWAIGDLSGKAGHVRTVPVPDWVYSQLSEWITAAVSKRGRFSDG